MSYQKPSKAEVNMILDAWFKVQEALKHAEAVMSIVEPRSHKAEYLACLHQIRAALGKSDQ